MKTFYTDKTATVFYDESLDCLFLRYQDKVPNDDTFVKINTTVLQAFQSLKTQNFVADIRRMGIISLASQQWVVDNLLPGMVKHLNGKMLYHAQLLDPSEILSKVSGSNIRSKSHQVANGFEVEQFSNEDDLRKSLQRKIKN
jgi:hypothetical protein